jgi:hypothetical protein
MAQVIALTPPAIVDAMRDPQVTGTTRRMYDWCVLHLDWQQYRSVKKAGLDRRMADKLEALVSLGYLDKRPRPADEPDQYRLLWSRKERAA